MSALISIVAVSLFLLLMGGVAVCWSPRISSTSRAPTRSWCSRDGRTARPAYEGRGLSHHQGRPRLPHPLIETVDRVDLTNMVIDVVVTNAYSRGGIPLTVQGVPTSRSQAASPSSATPSSDSSVGIAAIIKVAKDTLEGNLRGVLSQLTPEQVNEDKISFAEKLLEEPSTISAGWDWSSTPSRSRTSRTTWATWIPSDVSRRPRSSSRRESTRRTPRPSISEEAHSNQVAKVRDLDAGRILEANIQRQITDAKSRARR